jgi:acyl-CoA synthetase (AMP-forming)/AMP-acid ligase II
VTHAATLIDALVDAASCSRGVRVIEHDGSGAAFSYAELLDDALCVAGALADRGLAPGDRVALVIPGVGDFIRTFFGISAAGLVPVPLCPPTQAGDLPTFARQTRHILAACRARAIITTLDVAPLLDITLLDPAPHIVTIDTLDTSTPLACPIGVDAQSCALLQFTSGSTAAPKGVVLTHTGLRANMAAISGPDGLDAGPSDRGVSWLPLYHDMGLIGMLLSAVYATVDTVIMSPAWFLKRPTAWLEAMSTFRGTISFAPNFAYELCVRRVKPSQVAALDLSSWRIAGCGAEPVRPETLRAFADHFAPAGFDASSFTPSYGLAENALAVAFSRRRLRVDAVDGTRLVRDSVAVPLADDAPGVMRFVSCGRTFSDHEIRIVGDDGTQQPERHVGSIVTRGPSVMREYFEDPEATDEALRDGFLHTGDLGYIADGDLFLCGRTKDLIIRHGRKYHPQDLESTIGELPGIRQSAVVVFGIDRGDAPDDVIAVLEARASTAAGMVDRVRRRIRETAGLELDHVVLTPPGTIPRTTSGKVRRSETRAQFQAGLLPPARAEREELQP